MKRAILVTGGAGFIGSHTSVELLAAGFDRRAEAAPYDCGLRLRPTIAAYALARFFVGRGFSATRRRMDLIDFGAMNPRDPAR